MWQHTDCGKVEGIKGFVDCNIFNGTVQDLEAFTIQDKDEEFHKEEIEEL
jgi:lysozyme